MPLPDTGPEFDFELRPHSVYEDRVVLRYRIFGRPTTAGSRILTIQNVKTIQHLHNVTGAFLARYAKDAQAHS